MRWKLLKATVFVSVACSIGCGPTITASQRAKWAEAKRQEKLKQEQAEREKRALEARLVALEEAGDWRAWARFLALDESAARIDYRRSQASRKQLWKLLEAKAATVTLEKVRKELKTLTTGGSVGRGYAAFKLGKMGRDAEQAVPYLEVLMLLNHSALKWAVNPMTSGRPTSPSREASRALQRIGGAGLDVLLETVALQGRTHLPQASCAEALGAAKDSRVAPALIESMGRFEVAYRAAWVESLTRTGDPRALAAIASTFAEAVKSNRRPSGTVAVLIECAEAFERLGDSSIVPLLVETAHVDPERIARTKPATKPDPKQSRHGRGWVSEPRAAPSMIDALGRIGDRRAVPLLLDLCYVDHMSGAVDIRFRAIRALGRIGDPAAIPALAQIARGEGHLDPIPNLRLAAAKALYEFKSDPRAAETFSLIVTRHEGNEQERRLYEFCKFASIEATPTLSEWSRFVALDPSFTRLDLDVREASKKKLWEHFKKEAESIKSEWVRTQVLKLASKSSTTSAKAAYALGKQGAKSKEAIPFLEVVVLLEHGRLRWTRFPRLPNAPGEPTSPSLEAAKALTRIDRAGNDVLLALLQLTPSYTKQPHENCIKALRYAKDERLFASLVAAVEKADKPKRYMWIELLSLSGDKRAAQPIASAFRSELKEPKPSSLVLYNCGKAFAALGDADVVPMLIETAHVPAEFIARKGPVKQADGELPSKQYGGWFGRHWETRRITETLGALGDRRATPLLTDLCYVDGVDGASDIRHSAITALGKLADPAAIPALVEIVKGDGHIDRLPYNRLAAAKALHQFIKDPRARAAFEAVTKDPNDKSNAKPLYGYCLRALE